MLGAVLVDPALSPHAWETFAVVTAATQSNLELTTWRHEPDPPHGSVVLEPGPSLQEANISSPIDPQKTELGQRRARGRASGSRSATLSRMRESRASRGPTSLNVRTGRMPEGWLSSGAQVSSGDNRSPSSGMTYPSRSWAEVSHEQQTIFRLFP